MSEQATTRVLSGFGISVKPKPTLLQHLVKFARRKPLGALGAVVLILAVVLAFIGPHITPHDPYHIDTGPQYDSPNGNTWFGTDQLGRDVFSRLMVGTRVSMYVGIISVLAGVTLGTILGILSAYFGGTTDLITQRVVDALMAFPALVLALAIMATLGPSENNVVIALVVVFVPGVSRTVRSQVLSLKEMDHILSARAVGAGAWRIVLRHIAPNTFATAIILMSLTLGWAIVVEASLSFLGLGTPQDVPSWGGMLNRGAIHWIEIQPFLGIMPGLAIVVIVFAANFLGDALRDVFDPRLRGTGG